LGKKREVRYLSQKKKQKKKGEEIITAKKGKKKKGGAETSCETVQKGKGEEDLLSS